MASSQGKSFNQMLLESFKTKGDVTFSVGEPGQEEEIKASVYILSVASPVFDTMFNSTWNEQKKVVKLPDIRPNVFRNFLKLLMTGDLKESHIRGLKLSLLDVFDILYVAKKYDVTFIYSVCTQFLKDQMGFRNVVVIYKYAGMWNEVDLENSAFAFIARNSTHVFQKDEFLNISRDTLARLLESNDLVIQETLLFQIMCKWAQGQCVGPKSTKTGKNLRKVLGDLFFLIRFPLMSGVDIDKVVRPTQILSDKELLDLYEYHCAPSSERLMKLPFSTSPRSWEPPMIQIGDKRGKCFIIRQTDNPHLVQIW